MILVSTLLVLNCFLKIEYRVAIAIAIMYSFGAIHEIFLRISIIEAYPTFGSPDIPISPFLLTLTNLESIFFLGILMFTSLRYPLSLLFNPIFGPISPI